MSGLEFNLTVVNRLEAEQRLRLLMMDDSRRLRVLKRIGTKVRQAARARVNAQVDIEGAAYPKHKRHAKRQMLKRLIKRLQITEINNGAMALGFPGLAGRIAFYQQYGKQTRMTGAKARQESQEQGISDTRRITRRMARAMQLLGYKVGGRRASIKYITDNLSYRQALGIMHQLKEAAGQSPANAWVTTLPPRSMLGATDEQINEYTRDAIDAVVNYRRA